MNKEEILQLNMIKSEGTSDFIFEDDKIFPSTIVLHSPTYGDYKMMPAAYIKVIGPDYKKISQASSEVRKLSGAVTLYTIEEIVVHNHKQSVEFVIYLCDYDDNQDWYEKNKDNPKCKILQQYPEYHLNVFLEYHGNNNYHHL